MWALLCLATFVWMVTMPTPYQGDVAERCPSLVTMFRSGMDPSLAKKAQLGLGHDGAYFRCSRHAAVPWATLSAVVPTLLAVAGWMVVLLQGIVNERWPQDPPAQLGWPPPPAFPPSQGGRWVGLNAGRRPRGRS